MRNGDGVAGSAHEEWGWGSYLCIIMRNGDGLGLWPWLGIVAGSVAGSAHEEWGWVCT